MITVKGINDKEPVILYPTDAEIMYQDERETEPTIEPTPRSEPDIEPTLQSQALLAKRLGAVVEITGAWAWASWQSKPPDAIRQALKDNGWIWCRHKGKWAWRSEPSHSRRAMPWDYIVNKYGLRQLQTELIEV